MTAIKGLGRRFSNLACKKAEVDLRKRAGELSAEELEQLMLICANPRSYKIPDWFLNRQRDYKDGSYSQLTSSALDSKLREDLERLKKARVHRGLRHYWGKYFQFHYIFFFIILARDYLDSQPNCKTLRMFFSRVISSIQTTTAKRSNRATTSNVSESDVCETFLCPITGDLMEYPVVVAGSGNIYDREAISNWFQNSSKDPLTNVNLKGEEKRLIPLHPLRSAIQELLVQQRTKVDEAEEADDSQFVRILDSFGYAFPHLFNEQQDNLLSQRHLLHTRSKLVKLLKNAQHIQQENGEIETDETNMGIDQESISMVITQLEMQLHNNDEQLKKHKLRSQVKANLKEMVSSLLIRSPLKVYSRIQELGVRPTRYLPATNSLMIATQSFQQSFDNMLSIMAIILERDVTVEQFEEAQREIDAQIPTIAPAITTIFRLKESIKQVNHSLEIFQQNLSAFSSSLDLHQIQDNKNGEDDMFAPLRNLSHQFCKTRTQLSQHFQNKFLCLVNQRKLLNLIKGEGVTTYINESMGLKTINFTKPLRLQNLEIHGHGELWGCLKLEGQGQSIEIIDSKFQNLSLVLTDFSAVSVRRVQISNAPCSGLYISEATHVTINNCTSRQNKYSGFYFNQVQEVKIEDCETIGNGSNKGATFNSVPNVQIRGCNWIEER
eukprot:TRINITY_DN1763_c0_g1_i4.p1 TRINITY_DN1763_c0_g1~~TRINITY_DN1763_c0_g1_i4.p1  ORF type:complete len:757 (+),score=57.88 TRINITY_DN1763_c0_g1_i4:277-2271(+)